MIRACFASLVLLAIASPALSQDGSGRAAYNPVIHSAPSANSSGVRTVLAGHSADNSMRESLSRPERVKRAERLADLANSGQCLAAYRIALRENDAQIAANLATVCDLPARDVRSIRQLSYR